MHLEGPPLWRYRGRSQPTNEVEHFWNRSLDTATSDNWKVTYQPWLTTLALILTSFSHSVVSDQCPTSSRKARVPA
jgi:hypothetical protein